MEYLKLNGIITSTSSFVINHSTTSLNSSILLPLFLLLIPIIPIVFLKPLLSLNPKPEFPIVNRTFALEPSILARIRFAFSSEKILHDAYRKVESFMLIGMQSVGTRH